MQSLNSSTSTAVKCDKLPRSMSQYNYTTMDNNGSHCTFDIPPGSQFSSSHKSDMQITSRSQCKSTSSFKLQKKNNWEYYKRYEHDEMPVKEYASSEYATGDSQRQFPKLTDSLLDRIEQKVLHTCSRPQPETHMDNSHIKFFKTTVEEIFDTFYTALRDIESFKERYQKIIDKSSPKQTEKEMELFIKDIIQEIKSNESMKTDELAALNTVAAKVHSESETAASVIEAYKNNKYDKDSSAEDSFSTPNKNEVMNIFFLTGSPSVEINVMERNMLSEVKIKGSAVQSRVKSADNFKMIAEQRKMLDAITDQVVEHERQEREIIPIKSGIPKKDLYLNEDFQCENDKNEKTLMQKLCSYICKKIRRTTN